jgi:hypothetical protein
MDGTLGCCVRVLCVRVWFCGSVGVQRVQCEVAVHTRVRTCVGLMRCACLVCLCEYALWW